MMTNKKQIKETEQEVELRRRYCALRIHHSYEKVAAVFQPTDLEFLLTDPDSLKVTYLADHVDLPRGAQLQQWVSAGLIAAHARLATHAGYTPSTLAECVDLAFEIGPEISRQDWLEILIKHPRPIDFFKACEASAVGGVWLYAGLRSGAALSLIKDFRAAGVPPRYLTEDIIAGTKDVKTIHEWYAAGISPQSSELFIKAGLTATDALSWLQAGFIPEEILKFLSTQQPPSLCKLNLPDVPYSKAFRRTEEGQFSIAGPYVHRVWRAVSALDVPSTYQSMIFSTSSTSRIFLDGGYFSVAGYGFGSHSYTMIKGELALRFLCFRIGVRPPRKNTGKLEAGQDQEALESAFQTWRKNAESGEKSMV